MSISLHNNGGETATKATTLQDLHQEIREDDANHARDPREFDNFPIAFPDSETTDDVYSARESIRVRVITLFDAALKTLRTANGDRMFADYLLGFRASSQHFDSEDLQDALESAYALVNPEDPNFCASIADRSSGLIKLLIEVVDYANRYDDPRTAFWYIRRFGREVEQDGVKKPIIELPWEPEEGSINPKDTFAYRKSLLKHRLNLMRAAGLHVENNLLLEELFERFPGQKPFIKVLNTVFQQAAMRLQLNKYQREQWLNVILVNVNRLPEITNGAFEAIKNLAGAIEKAKSQHELGTVIDVFSKQTVPGLLPKQK